MVCNVCRHDAPYTRAQLARRQQELDRNPTLDVYPCPDCGGRDYMLATVNIDKEPLQQYEGILSTDKRQLAAQDRAQKQAQLSKQPVDDGYGTRWYPPGLDGIPIASPTSRRRSLWYRLHAWWGHLWK
jgi:hypothetical protein